MKFCHLFILIVMPLQVWIAAAIFTPRGMLKYEIPALVQKVKRLSNG